MFKVRTLGQVSRVPLRLTQHIRLHHRPPVFAKERRLLPPTADPLCRDGADGARDEADDAAGWLGDRGQSVLTLVAKPDRAKHLRRRNIGGQKPRKADFRIAHCIADRRVAAFGIPPIQTLFLQLQNAS